MGQYFKAAVKTANAKSWKSYKTWDINSSAKLSEHAYMDDPFMVYVKEQLMKHPMMVVWAGDYAKPETGKTKNLYDSARGCKIDAEKALPIIYADFGKMKYIVNHSKGIYLDYSTIQEDEYGCKIDPLAILCAEGNGEGGGDYYYDNKDLAGCWARDIISISEKAPEGYAEFANPFPKFND